MRIRKGIAVFCLAVMVMLSAGTYLVFSLLKHELHSEMNRMIRSGLISKQSTSLSFTKHEMERIEWINEDEFILNGELYDLISASEKNGRVVMRVVCDGKEKKLFEGIRVFTHGGKDAKANGPLTKIGELFSLKYLATNDPLIPPADISAHMFIPIPEPEINSISLSVIAPPPEFF